VISHFNTPSLRRDSIRHECKVCCTFSEGKLLFSHEEYIDSPHDVGETVIFRPIKICCTVVMRVTMSLSVLLILGVGTSDLAIWCLDDGASGVDAAAGAAA
jgi:hypothetical protein